MSVRFRGRFAFIVMACIVIAGLLIAPEAGAAVRRFESLLEDNRVTVGVPFRYVIAIETDGETPRGLPSEPEWGELRVIQGPVHSQELRSINGVQRLRIYIQYLLIADSPGDFEIGSSTLNLDGDVLETGKEPISAQAPDLSKVPESLRERGILHPIADDPGITRQLEGRAFILPEISNSAPYVGEPFTVAYYFYQERLPPPQNLRMDEPGAPSMLTEDPYLAKSITPTEIVTLDGRDYDVSLLYRNVFTPTQPGEFEIEGFNIQFRLPVKSSRSRRSRRGFDAFFDLDPMFSPMVTVQARVPAALIAVRPVPDDSRPLNFTGTVGNFKLTADIDKRVASEDDLITFAVTIRGEGNPALASPPELPENPDFELFDRTESVEKQRGAGTPGGSKTVEYLLRPMRSGTLTVPRLKYPIFNPKTGRFETLTTSAHRVQVAPGRSPQRQTVANAPAEGLPGIETQLDYLKPLIGLRRERPAPLHESPLFWGSQFVALVFALFGLFRHLRRENIDPAEERKRNSWAALDTKLARLEAARSPNETEETATALERALREFIADWFNLKADGLTAPEISFRLMAEGVPKEKIRRIEDIMEECAQARYAPTSDVSLNFTERAKEAKTILHEELNLP